MRSLALLLIFALAISCVGCQPEGGATLLEDEEYVEASAQRPEAKKMAQGHATEPMHEGKTLTDWAAQAKSERAEDRRAAAEALGHLGPPAVPVLTELLRDPDMGVRLAAATALKKAKEAQQRER